MAVTKRILTCLLRSESLMRSRLTRIPALAALMTGIATTAAAQLGERAIPGTYAITSARIVPVSGPAVDRGTIVIRDGLIIAVGPTVAAPADARIIDGAGLSVYPGFIDALSNVGVPARAQGGGGGGGGGNPFAQAAGPSPVAAPN